MRSRVGYFQGVEGETEGEMEGGMEGGKGGWADEKRLKRW